MSQNDVDLIGRDLKMNFDLSDIDTDRTDISTVEGNRNLAQAILLRLRTPIGSLPLQPEFGSRLSQLMGKGQRKENEYLARMMIGEALMKETRQVSVDNIEVNYDNDELYISFTVIGINTATSTNIEYSLRV